MSLFVCENCGCVENTALTRCSWTEYSEKKPMLCSQCCSKQKKWHGCFSRKKWDGKEEMLNRKNKNNL